jgi:hypothetical protein
MPDFMAFEDEARIRYSDTMPMSLCREYKPFELNEIINQETMNKKHLVYDACNEIAQLHLTIGFRSRQDSPRLSMCQSRSKRINFGPNLRTIDPSCRRYYQSRIASCFSRSSSSIILVASTITVHEHTSACASLRFSIASPRPPSIQLHSPNYHRCSAFHLPCS